MVYLLQTDSEVRDHDKPADMRKGLGVCLPCGSVDKRSVVPHWGPASESLVPRVLGAS